MMDLIHPYDGFDGSVMTEEQTIDAQVLEVVDDRNLSSKLVNLKRRFLDGKEILQTLYDFTTVFYFFDFMVDPGAGFLKATLTVQ